MISEMRESCHDSHIPITSVANPSTVGSKFLKTTDLWLYQISNAAVGVMDCTLVYGYLKTIRAFSIPSLSVGYGEVDNLKIRREIALTQMSILRLEPFARSSLIVAISANVRSLQNFPKLSLTNFARSDANVVR